MPNYITKEGLQKLKDELKELKTVEARRITGLIAEARAFGDLKENAGYHEARHMKSLLLGRIEQLENAINEAIVVESRGEGIEVGSQVELLFGDKKENYHIVSSTEADIFKNKISYESPLGKELMGKKKGDEFAFQAGSKQVKVKVISIS